MKVNGENVCFERAECSDLTTILCEYVTAIDGGKPAESTESLRSYWQAAGDLSTLNFPVRIASKGGGTIDESMLHRLFSALKDNGLLNLEVDEAVEIATGRKDLELRDAKAPLGKAFLWATANLIEGSVSIQNIVGEVLNSGFEDHGVSKALGSTNQEFADHIAESMLRAGVQAGAWLVQLESQN